MPLVPGAPHIALRCPVSKEPGAFPRKSVSLRREAPLLPSCGGVAVTLSGSRGIASHFPRFFPIFFPDMTGNDGFFPQKAPARGGFGDPAPGGSRPGCPGLHPRGRQASHPAHGVRIVFWPYRGFGRHIPVATKPPSSDPPTPASGAHEDCPLCPPQAGEEATPKFPA